MKTYISESHQEILDWLGDSSLTDFDSEQEVREYFTRENLELMFPGQDIEGGVELQEKAVELFLFHYEWKSNYSVQELPGGCFGILENWGQRRCVYGGDHCSDEGEIQAVYDAWDGAIEWNEHSKRHQIFCHREVEQ